ncbi:hypothetical protein V491_03601 [Pseudogymnoascus sp. VKM F-3775]|nr:hypothetical protein V491_03601 [Pseudogymnoascus sp. VKM F-3775]
MKCTILSNGRLALVTLAITQFSPILAHPSIEKRGVPIAMGAAKTYGAIAAMTITSTGGTAACAVEAACLSAYNNARALAPTATALPLSDLAGLALAPGVYKFPTSAVTNSAASHLTELRTLRVNSSSYQHNPYNCR